MAASISPGGLPPINDNPFAKGGFAAPLAPPAFRQDQDTATAQATRAKDQELLDHLCGHGCGCGSGGVAMGGEDPLKMLESRDWEVRQHEQQHFSNAGEFAAGGPEFETVTASNGRSYVVGGHVKVNIAEVAGDPRKTIAKMQQLQRAALSPAEPSDQDRKVACQAAAKEQEAMAKLREQDDSLGWNLAGHPKR